MRTNSNKCYNEACCRYYLLIQPELPLSSLFLNFSWYFHWFNVWFSLCSSKDISTLIRRLGSILKTHKAFACEHVRDSTRFVCYTFVNEWRSNEVGTRIYYARKIENFLKNLRMNIQNISHTNYAYFISSLFEIEFQRWVTTWLENLNRFYTDGFILQHMPLYGWKLQSKEATTAMILVVRIISGSRSRKARAFRIMNLSIFFYVDRCEAKLKGKLLISTRNW